MYSVKVIFQVVLMENTSDSKRKTIVKVLIFVLLLSLLSLSILQLETFTYNEPARRAWPKQLSFYDTSFWNITKAINDPLNITTINSEIRSYDDAFINFTDIFFFSESYNNVDIYIFAEILIPLNFSYPLPAILIIHGYGGSHSSFVDFAVEIVKQGYIAILIDAPDSGQSTPYPSKAPESLINTTNGPQDSYFYHVAWAGMRAISVLEKIPQVDKDRIAVTGGSMGGIMSFIIGAVDPRVKAIVPIVAGGNFVDCFLSGTLATALTTPNTSLDSEKITNFLRYFDVYAYASKLKIPTLMLSSTNDEYFTLIGLNDTFAIIPSEKWWFLAPNWHHFSAYPGWIKTSIRFLDYIFKNGTPLPHVDIESVSNTAFGITVYGKSSLENSNIWVVWRSGLPGDVWKLDRMTECNNNHFSVTIVPTFSGKVTFYLALEDPTTGLFIVTTHVKTIFVITSQALLAIVALLISLLGLIYFEKDVLSSFRNVLLYFSKKTNYYCTFGLTVLSFGGLWIDWIVFVNKTSLSFFTFVERYGNTFKVNPWGSVLPVVIFSFLFLSYLFTKRKVFSYSLVITFSLFTLVFVMLLRNITTDVLIVIPGIGGFITILSPLFLVVNELVIFKK